MTDLTTNEYPTAPPCLFVLFGCTGDLAARKIAPALYNLARDGRLDERFAVVGVSRRDWSDPTLREHMREAIAKYSRRELDKNTWEAFAERWHYQQVRVDEPGDYDALADRLARLDEQYQTGCSRVVYLAMPPEFYQPVTEHFGRVRFNRPICDGGFSRLIVEKPFGHDRASAAALNEHIHRQGFDESQVFRIDHYLGKEQVQNILIFRFANALFEPFFSREHVQRVEITTAEAVGMEGRRGPYYEKTGALRDMVQNHMLQLLALVAMDRPGCLRCDAIRDAKLALLQAIEPMTPSQVARCTVRGQYVGSGNQPAYRQEQGVAEDSQVETFAALRLGIDNDRWRCVPFYLRTGKALARKMSQIVLTFRREVPDLFAGEQCDMRGQNRLVIRITPEEGIALHFDAKVPGAQTLLRPVSMDFRYDSAFDSASPEAYEQLLLDAMRGDATLFIRGDEIDAAWAVVDPIRTAWDAGAGPELEFYRPGSWGPAGAEEIFQDPYQSWYLRDG